MLVIGFGEVLFSVWRRGKLLVTKALLFECVKRAKNVTAKLIVIAS